MKNGFLYILIILLMYTCSSPTKYKERDKIEVSYSIPIYSHVIVLVENSYDIVVANLVNEYKDGGSYKIEYDPSELVEGLYYFVLKAKPKNSDEYHIFEKKFGSIWNTVGNQISIFQK